MASSIKSITKLQKIFNITKVYPKNRTYFTYSLEPAQPIKGKEPIWTTGEEALSILKSGILLFLFIKNN